MIKTTKRDYFEMLAAMVDASNADNKTELQSFIANELELLDKKKARASSKTSKTAQANASTKEAILARLAECDTAMTITEFQKKFIEDFPYAVGDGTGFSNQKLSVLFRQLVEEGKVTKEVIKKKSYFFLAADDEAADDEA